MRSGWRGDPAAAMPEVDQGWPVFREEGTRGLNLSARDPPCPQTVARAELSSRPSGTRPWAAAPARPAKPRRLSSRRAERFCAGRRSRSAGVAIPLRQCRKWIRAGLCSARRGTRGLDLSARDPPCPQTVARAGRLQQAIGHPPLGSCPGSAAKPRRLSSRRAARCCAGRRSRRRTRQDRRRAPGAAAPGRSGRAAPPES